MDTSKTPRWDITRLSQDGRPHSYQSYFVANIRMVLDMEVQAGNQTAPLYAQPELWTLLDGLAEPNRPTFLRGDSHWGAEKAMIGAEERKIGFLFQTQAERECEETDRTNVCERGNGRRRGKNWREGGKCCGWRDGGKERQVVVLRRPLRIKPAAEAVAGERRSADEKPAKQLTLDLPELTYKGIEYE